VNFVDFDFYTHRLAAALYYCGLYILYILCIFVDYRTVKPDIMNINDPAPSGKYRNITAALIMFQQVSKTAKPS